MNKEVDDHQVMSTMLKNKKRRTSSSSTMVLNGFDLLPEEVITDQILLKLPVESLLRLRCVSKWSRSLITSPNFVRLHTQLAHDHDSDLILFSTRACEEYIRFPSGNIVKNKSRYYLVRNYICKFSAADRRDTSRPEVVEMNCPFPYTDIRASCNGLLYVHGRPICKENSSPSHCFSQGYVYTSKTQVTRKISPSYIWNPCTKEYKKLPRPPPSTLLQDQQVVYFDDGIGWSQRTNIINARSNSSYNCAGFCGFGYDCSNDQYKILYYEHLNGKCNTSSSVHTTEFKIYTLGTNTWKTIDDNPYRSLFFGQQWLSIGLFVNGALHWIMSSEVSSRCATKAKIISFDIVKEVFLEVQKPPHLGTEYYGNLQLLRGCLCVCQFPLQSYNEEVDIWMLKDYAAKNSWTKFLRFVLPQYPCPFQGALSVGYLKLLRYLENGEIVMLTDCRDLVMYYPYYQFVTPAQNFTEDVKGSWEYQMNYRKSLVSLNTGTYSTSTKYITASYLAAYCN